MNRDAFLAILAFDSYNRKIAGTVYSLIARPAFAGNRYRFAAG